MKKMQQNKKTKLLSAMSGGVDSSVATAIFIENGFDVVGVTLKFFDCESFSDKKKACCDIEDRRQVINVCEKLNIEHYFLDVKELFEEKVLRYCWNEYSVGRTPNPCVLCNRHIKIRGLIEYAKSIGAEGIITGHYAKIAKSPDGFVRLSRGKDPNKDQSYFLSLVEPELLSNTYTPLSSMKKSEVRAKAKELGLPNAEKKESQDACVGTLGANFAETLRRKFNGTATVGNFLDERGKIIGKHNGIHNFTIGQRRGFGMGFGKPMFVKKINANEGEIILTDNENSLFSSKLELTNINWLSKALKEEKFFEALVQIRYRSKATKARIFNFKDQVLIEFFEPQRAITPGQTAVIYDYDDSVIAGGIINLCSSSFE